MGPVAQQSVSSSASNSHCSQHALTSIRIANSSSKNCHKASPDNIVYEFPGKSECFKLLKDLNREVSAYHNMALALGGSGDCEQLRGELKRTRRKAQELANLNKVKLTLHSQDSQLTIDERQEIERLWCLLYCCLCVLAVEMQRTLQLQQTFALHAAPAGFINTGLDEYDVGHKGGTDAHALDVPLADRLSLERAETSQLQKEILELDVVLQELRNCVDIDTYLHGDILCKPIDFSSSGSLHSDSGHISQLGDSDLSSVVDDSGISSSHRRCLCAIMVVMISIFVLAAILGVCMAFIT